MVVIYIVILIVKIIFAYSQGIERCPEGEFMCGGPSYSCIEQEYVCDGQRHCKDGSDETSNLCQYRSCSRPLDFINGLSDVLAVGLAQQFRCSYGACVPFHVICNGIKDCFEGSDETYELCHNLGRCERREFRCDYGACVSSSVRCNGRKDCADGSDETVELCLKSRRRRRCSRYHFQCDYGACIAKRKTCNGRADCADESDETTKLCGPNHNFISSTTTLITTTHLPTTTTSTNTEMETTSSVSSTSKTTDFETSSLPPSTKIQSSALPNTTDTTMITIDSTFDTTTSVISDPLTIIISNVEETTGTTVKQKNDSVHSDVTDFETSTPAGGCPHLHCLCPNLFNVCVPCAQITDVTKACEEAAQTPKLCSVEKSDGVAIDILSCDASKSTLFQPNLLDIFHRTISQSQCSFVVGAVPSTLAWVDCWGKHSGLYECKTDGLWYSDSTEGDVISTETLCQPDHLNHQVCGKNPYIRKDSDDFSWPFLVSLIQDGGFSCIGTVISRHFVLTAAHCVYEDYKKIKSGLNATLKIDHSLSSVRDEISEVSEIFIHPNFSFYENLQSDVALLRLGDPLKITEQLSPACIDGEERIFDPIAATFRRNPKNFRTKWNVLPHTLDVECFNKESRCTRHLHLSDDQYCGITTALDGHLDRGSSGGPYLVNAGSEHNEKWTVAGVMSNVVHSTECRSKPIFITIQDKWKWISKCVYSEDCPSYVWCPNNVKSQRGC